ELRRVWEEGRAIWQPLAERLNDTRFAGRGAGPELWIERYLRNRAASYLFAGFSYAWDDPLVAQPAFAEQVIAHVLELLPLNEAVMEQAEQGAPSGAGLLREQRPGYLALPAIDEIVARVRARGMALPDDLVRAYHLALQTRPLVILPGISGTG